MPTRGSLAPILKKPALPPVLASMMGTAQRHGVTEQGSGVIAVVVHGQVFRRAAYDRASISADRRSPDLLPMRRLVALDVGAVLPTCSVPFYTSPTAMAARLRGEAGGAYRERHGFGTGAGAVEGVGACRRLPATSS